MAYSCCFCSRGNLHFLLKSFVTFATGWGPTFDFGFEDDAEWGRLANRRWRVHCSQLRPRSSRTTTSLLRSSTACPLKRRPWPDHVSRLEPQSRMWCLMRGVNPDAWVGPVAQKVRSWNCFELIQILKLSMRQLFFEFKARFLRIFKIHLNW